MDNGDGCVLPSDETIAEGTYQPLSRPIFMYVNAEDAEREEVQAFLEFLLTEGPQIIREVGYIPFPDETYETLLDRVMSRRSGSAVMDADTSEGTRLSDLLFEEERE